MRGPRQIGSWALFGALAALALASGCASSGANAGSGPPPAPPEPTGQVYSYPTRGQSAERQERDRYECYQWSLRQTRFDPSVAPRAVSAPAPAARVVPVPPPGAGLLGGAIAGALIGAAVSCWDNQAAGAAWGAAAGALVGGLSDAWRVQQARELNSVYASRASATSSFDAREGDFRRALSACLQGRGYTVQ